MRLHHMCNHFANRRRFAQSAPRVARLKPIETDILIVRAPLLREQKRKSMLPREHRPTSSEIIPCCGLRAPVKNDNERRSRSEVLWRIFQHAEIASVCAKRGNFLKGAIAQPRCSRLMFHRGVHHLPIVKNRAYRALQASHMGVQSRRSAFLLHCTNRRLRRAFKGKGDPGLTYTIRDEHPILAPDKACNGE